MNEFPSSVPQPESNFVPQLGRYRIAREIGRGFSSIVYEAVDTMRGRPVALKVLTLGQTLTPERRVDMAERFLREARAISALSHPGIVSIYEVGQTGDGGHFIAMELLEGETLRARLDHEGALPAEDAVPLVLQVAGALQYAHERGIIHRDVKPDNIFVLPDGRAKLMDFGVAHVLSEEVLTQAGTVVGSPAYMSPEQIGGQMLDGGSDVFSLGVTLAEMLTGHKPFDAPSIPAVMNRILHRPPQLDRIQPRALHRVVERALAKNPLSRYAGAAAFADALRDQVQPQLATLISSSTMIMPSPLPVHHRSAADTLRGYSTAFSDTVPSSRTVLGGVGLACLAALLAFSLLRHQSLPLETITVHRVQMARIPAAWRRAPMVRTLWHRHPAQTVPYPEPIVSSLPGHVDAPMPVGRPMLVVTPTAQPVPSRVATVSGVPHTDAPPVAVVRVADTRQEQRRPTIPEILLPPASAEPSPPQTPVVRDAPARLSQNTPAVYPDDLRSAGITGTVSLRLAVDADGKVTEATVVHSSGVDDLDAAALDAVGHWKYTPALQNGQPVAATVTARIAFPDTSGTG